MNKPKTLVLLTAFIVFSMCLYAFILCESNVQGGFDKAIGWYFLAKGIFCSVSLYLSYLIIEQFKCLKK